MNDTEKLENCRKALLAAEKLIAAQAALMACLRISKRPSEKTLDEVGKKAGVDIQIARAIHDATLKDSRHNVDVDTSPLNKTL